MTEDIRSFEVDRYPPSNAEGDVIAWDGAHEFDPLSYEMTFGSERRPEPPPLLNHIGTTGVPITTSVRPLLIGRKAMKLTACCRRRGSADFSRSRSSV